MICAECGVYMKVQTNGVAVVGSERIVMGDLYECPFCKIEIVSGLGKPFPTESIRIPADCVIYTKHSI